MRVLSIAMMLVSLVVASSCSSIKMDKKLLYHSAQLQQLTKRDMAPLEKMDVFAALIVEALEESLEFSKPKNSIKFLKRYSKENKNAVDVLYREMEQWYTGLSAGERLEANVRLITKPYIRQLLNLVPKVEKKINRKLKTVFFLARFTSLLKIA